MTTGMFDDLMDAPTTQPTVTEDNKPEANEPQASEKAETPRETLTVESLDVLPDGYVDVKGFAWELTKLNLANAQAENRVPGPEDMVDTQAVYAATRGKRWALPSLEAVTPDGTKLGIVIPLSAGLTAWNERPERGTGGTVVMTPERRATRILRAGKAKAQLDKLTKLVKRKGELLAEVGATWDDADRAYNEWLETEDAKKEIADSDKNEANGDD